MDKNETHELVSHGRLNELSPVGSIPWDEPGLHELYQFRWETWRRIRASTLVDSPWSKSVFDGLFGSHPLSWRVVGMTHSALQRLGGEDGSFTGKREPGVYIRSHLFPRRENTVSLRALHPDTTFEDFVQITWPRDITVIGLKSEDRLLEVPDYHRTAAVTWRNDRGTLFTEAGKGWKYTARERQFLREVVSR